MWKTMLQKFRRFSVHIFLLIGLVITLTPFVWMISTSFKSSESIFTYPPQWVPKSPTLENYQRLFGIESPQVREKKGKLGFDFGVCTKNSLIIAIAITILSLFVNALAAFAFAKLNFPGKEKIFALLLTTLMVPGQMTMIPVFLILKSLGLLNSYFGLIIPAMASAFNIFLIRQFMSSIPNELIESARIDGCSDFRIFWNIILPLCKPVLAALGVFAFMGAWNNFLWPLIVLTKESKYTLPVALANLSGEYATDYGLLMGGSLIVVAPMILIFLFAQKFIIGSFSTTGLKG
ncbi:MAG: carbohydrate ABC transporter permease [Elusimicrobiota bacterium]